jgi:DUF1680 family protein
LLLIGLASAIGSSASEPALKGKRVIEPFDYHGVTLADGDLKRQFDEVRSFYLNIPNDDLLKGFRERGGLPAPGIELGGWYSQDIGNIFGQVLSGLARMYAAAGDPRCREKAVALAQEWGRCIGGDGYPFYSLHPAGAAYTYDKLVGGLVDLYVYCGDRDALTYLSRITEWAAANLNRVRDYANADGAGMPRAPWAEWYTLSENLYRAYLATGNVKYRDFAEVWEYTQYWDLYAKKADIFGTRPNGERSDCYHAYSHVNTLSGAAAAYLVKGDVHYLDTLENAYDYLWENQTYATGGYGPGEMLLPRDRLVAMLTQLNNGIETQCGTWAAFKLAKYLISFTGDARYGEWIERLLYNCIGASLPMSADGRVFYYASYHLDGATKHLYDSGWACCSGTRPIAIADYHDLIYFRDKDALYVNLYAPSTVRWERQGGSITIRQRTRFPESDRAEFTLSLQHPTRFALKVRIPEWLAAPMTATLNGNPVRLRNDDRHWAVIERDWRDGDVLSLTLPIRFWLSVLDRTRGYPAAVMYGPIAMAFRSPAGNPSTKVEFNNLDGAFVPSAGEPLTFHLAADPSVLVRPFYAFREGERYYIYLDPERATSPSAASEDG